MRGIRRLARWPRLLGRPPTRRQLALLLGGLAVAAIAVWAGLVIPWRPARIVGGSMAPRLLGAHWDVCCPDCRWSYACGAEFFSDAWPLTCPHCGAGAQQVAAHPSPGDRVWIDYRYRLWTRPARWDVVALRLPQGDLVAKRVVGLPGERLVLRDGDLWMDGRPLQRPLAALLDTCILIHDDRFRPCRGQPLWRTARSATAWQTLADGYCFSLPEQGQLSALDTAPRGGRDWLEFHPPASGAPGEPITGITDRYAYNAALPRRLSVCDDRLLTASLTMDAQSRLSIHWNYRQRVWRLDLDACRAQASLASGIATRPDQVAGWGRPARARAGCLAVAAVDQRVRVWWNGEVLLDLPMASVDPQPVPAPRERPIWGLLASGGSVTVRHLRLFRDLHLLAKPAGQGDGDDVQQWELGPDEYWVLGDNLPVSQDSRTWGPVSRRQLVGRVFRSRPW